MRRASFASPWLVVCVPEASLRQTSLRERRSDTAVPSRSGKRSAAVARCQARGRDRPDAERLSLARAGGATTINFDEESVVERLNELTAGKWPEKCIDAVVMEAHASATVDSMYDRAKQTVMRLPALGAGRTRRWPF